MPDPVSKITSAIAAAKAVQDAAKQAAHDIAAERAKAQEAEASQGA